MIEAFRAYLKEKKVELTAEQLAWWESLFVPKTLRKHDFIFLPPGVEHAISNSGLVDLVFLVITSPVTDGERPA